MKIGFFCNEYPPRPHGGIGTFVRQIAQALTDAGHEVTVVEFGPRGETRSVDGVRLITLPEIRARGLAWLANRLRLAGWLWQAARRGEIQVFEIHDFQGWLPFPYNPCPVVVRLHHAQSHIEAALRNETHSRAMYWLERQTLRWHPRWIAVSRYILEAERVFFRCAPRLASVIHNPVPLLNAGQQSNPTPPLGPYLLFVGSVSERKGTLLLAEAAAPLLAENPQLSLVYIGAETNYNGQPISEAIRRQVGARVSDRLLFLGSLSHKQVLSWMASAIALVLPSLVEAFPLVALEAMSVGIPVVMSRIGPGPELVEDGVTGLLVDPRSVEEVRDCIARLVDDPGFARALGAAAKRTVAERFALHRCVEETLSFYQRCLENRT